MTSSTPTPAGPFQRVAATLINLGIVLVLGFLAEQIAATAGAPTAAARAAIAIKAWFGLTTLFWLGCGHMRTSPGLALLKLRVVPVETPTKPITLMTALLRPLPFYLFGMVVVFPVELIPRSVAPVQFILVLASSLLLAANAAPLWSGPNRYSLLDRWLKTRVVHR